MRKMDAREFAYGDNAASAMPEAVFFEGCLNGIG